MTEAEWLASKRSPDLVNCLRWTLQKENIERTYRLAACACCRRHWSILAGTDAATAIEIAEAFADGAVGVDELNRGKAIAEAFNAASVAGFRANGFQKEYLKSVASLACYYAADCVGDAFNAVHRTANHAAQVRAYRVLGAGAQMNDQWRHHKWLEYEAQTHLIRDIFGNPFRPVTVDPSWRTEAVVALARGMYESRDFAPMPVLADALEDAGCADADILAHCRGNGPHVRGCWVVDLVLGKNYTPPGND